MTDTDIYLAYLNYKAHAYHAWRTNQVGDEALYIPYIDYRMSYLRLLADIAQET